MSKANVPVLSHSQMQTFADCPYQWYLQRVRRVKQLTAAWFHHGTAVHEAIEAWTLSDRSIDAVERFYREYDDIIERHMSTHPSETEWLRGGRKTRNEDISQRRELGAEQVRWYTRWAREQPWRSWRLPDPYSDPGPYAAEVSFLVRYGRVAVRGIADDVWEYPDGRLVVVDYKTGTRTPESDAQLGLYAVALSDIFGVKIDSAGYLMVRDKKLVPADLSRYDRAWMADTYGRTVDLMRAGEYPARPGSCYTCTVKRHCEFAS